MRTPGEVGDYWGSLYETKSASPGNLVALGKLRRLQEEPTQQGSPTRAPLLVKTCANAEHLCWITHAAFVASDPHEEIVSTVYGAMSTRRG